MIQVSAEIYVCDECNNLCADEGDSLMDSQKFFLLIEKHHQ